MGLSDPCFGKIALRVFGFSKTDSKVHIWLLSGLYASSLGNGMVAAALDKVIIVPNETFSFWKLVRYADRDIPYKDGLTVVDGKLTTTSGGGLCQMNNLLFWMFLHTPFTVVERYGHGIKDFPELPSDAPMGVDATISEC